MTADKILKEDVSDFASRLEAMRTDEVFAAMSALEEFSEAGDRSREPTFSRIALVEDEIERRFPGQLLVPYRDWKKERTFSS